MIIYGLPGFEFLFAIAVAVAIGRIASNDKQSGWTWGSVTFVLCIASFYTIPLPYLRLTFVGILAFVLMILYKVVLNK